MESKRKSDHPVNHLILNRWSSRAMTGEELSPEEIKSLFEAARWAPSSYNNQPWRFIYARRNTEHWNRIFELLVDFNKQWCVNAAVLGVIVGSKTFEKNKKLSRTYALDTGAAWENLALEGCSRNLVVHGMEGFDYEKAKKNLQVPEDYEVLAMFAVGRKGPKEALSKELQEKEVPSSRKKIEEFVFEGNFGNRAGF